MFDSWDGMRWDVIRHCLASFPISVACKECGWNEDLVRQAFLPYDALLILSIPLLTWPVSDSLCWHYEKWGSYSVRSGYHLGYNLNLSPRPSGLSGTESWWKYLWCIRAPAKVKLFLWRACRDWIPTYSNLAKRGIMVDCGYSLFQGNPGTTLHALWVWYQRNGRIHKSNLLVDKDVVPWAAAFHANFNAANFDDKATLDKGVACRISW
ncbi:hypothetical protein EZV62_022611 [Acer yangbiense]|uniref:Reverse transcriptase zinc-binding domain-containing protein n=1 Tax=Acer yangbiense TaxID=1000413 RepID=A0A5C7HA59_9ROSI|nr:hypothetical protein EZV62_022611 [Acer yangbiense]